MRKRDVEINAHYAAKISGKVTTVQIKAESRYGGWDAVNVTTGRNVHIKSAAKLRAKA